MFRLQAAAKGIDFVFKRPPVLPVVVYADEKRLRQVLINLLSNAIKFTQSGSVQFVVHYRSPVAEFEVIDTGPGIQASDLERIFAPFERGALGVSQPQTGTGLGLTISRLLAGVMGGDIRVTSAVGTGSTFRVKTAAVGSHQPDADRAGQCADLRLSRPAQDHPDHRRRSDPSRSPARGADAARLYPAQRARWTGLPDAGAALPAGPVPAGYLDGRHGRLDGGGDAALERPSPGPHPDGVGQRAGSAWHAAGAAVPRRLSDEADRYSKAAGTDPAVAQDRMAV